MEKKKNKSKKSPKKIKTKLKVYDFKVGKHIIGIEAETEPKAMVILIEKFWDFIDGNSKVELLGEQN